MGRVTPVKVYVRVFGGRGSGLGGSLEAGSGLAAEAGWNSDGLGGSG